MITSPGSHGTAAYDDQIVTTRIRAGDATAFETLFRSHYASLCSVAFRYLQSADGAEDVVQNVFRAVWLHRTTWFPYGAVGPYLRTAVRNEALNALRRARREQAAAEEVSPADLMGAGFSSRPSVEDSIAAAELSSAILDAADALAPRCRAVFLLKWQRGLSYPEIADRLGISIKTVEMQMTRALKTVRARIGAFRE